MMHPVFGLSLPTFDVVSPLLASALAQRMTEMEQALGAEHVPAALAASVRQDAQRYLGARRRGELRLPSASATRVCDERARNLLQLTVDAPPIAAPAERLVA